MPKISIDLPDVGPEKTYLIKDNVAGETGLTTKNTQGFVQNGFIVVGEPGTEAAEIRKINAAITDVSAMTVDALTHPHTKSTPIYRIDYDQVEVHSSTTKTGTYSLLGTAINLDVDNPDQTSYNDATGTDTTWYKIRYKNSISSAYSDFSDPIPATGYSDWSLNKMVKAVMSKIGDNLGKYLDKDVIKSMIRIRQTTWWYSPSTKRELKTTAILATTDDRAVIPEMLNYIELPDNFDKLVDEYAVHYRYNPNDGQDEWGCLRIKTKNQFYQEYSNNLALNSDDLKACYIDDTTSPKRLYLGPTPATTDQKIMIDYWMKPSLLVSDADETICPVPTLLTFPVAAEILNGRGETDRANSLMQMYAEITQGDGNHNRTQGGSQKMKFRRGYDRKRFR